MRIAIAGGTGLVGRYVVQAVTDAGHHPVILARSAGIDITTGAGLDEALTGVDTVIDVSNVTTRKAEESVAFFTTATGNLLDAGGRAGVRHQVLLSIVGIDRVGLGYYEGKRRQEDRLLAQAEVATVLRATQFHEFAGQLLRGSRGPVAIVPSMRTQPIAAREVAQALAALATGPVLGRAPELAGTAAEELPDLARRTLRAYGSHRLVLPVRLPGAVGKTLAGGGLLPTEPGPRGQQTFAEWLAAETSPSGPASHAAASGRR